MITKIGYKMVFPKEYSPENARKLDEYADKEGWWYYDPDDPDSATSKDTYDEIIDETNDRLNQEDYLKRHGIQSSLPSLDERYPGVYKAFLSGNPDEMKAVKAPMTHSRLAGALRGAKWGAGIGGIPAAMIGSAGGLRGAAQFGAAGGLLGAGLGALIGSNPENSVTTRLDGDYAKLRKAYVPGNSWKD